MLKKIALMTALALVLALLPGLATAEAGVATLTLEALEIDGTVNKLSDFPTIDMQVEITLYEDGLFWMDYHNKGQETSGIGAWERTKAGYELYLDSGAIWSLALGSHGYYALAGDGVNMLFRESGAAAQARQAARVNSALAPANIAAFSAPFGGDADDHVDAVDYVVGILDGASIAWQDDEAVSDDLGCARFAVNGGSVINIIYDRAEGTVPAYTCRLEYAAGDGLNARVSQCYDDCWIHVPALAAMLIDVNYSENAFLNRLSGFDSSKQDAALQTALRQAFQSGAASADYFGYKLAVMADGAENCVWVVLHRTAGGVALPQLTATPKPTRTPKPTATPRPTRTPKPTATPRPTQPALKADEWLCPACGTVNSLNFCTECGTARPENKCPRCGTEYDADNKPNFCPECGYKLKDNK